MAEFVESLTLHLTATVDEQVKVLIMDQNQACRARSWRTVEDYLVSLLKLKSRSDLLTQLIQEEYGYREERPSSEQRCARFPELQTEPQSLRVLVTISLEQFASIICDGADREMQRRCVTD